MLKINCLLKFSKNIKNIYSFATGVTRNTINYYDILGVSSGATEQSIREAYARETQGLRPELDKDIFSQLSQAFVILTDSKTRDAYDSLLEVRKTNYLSQEAKEAPVIKSYLAQRKANKLAQLKKRLNIDDFGRYKGGLPNKINRIRGKSANLTGYHHRQFQVEEQLDRFPETHIIDREKAQSFGAYHQDERDARTMKWPWFTFEVNYDYFSFKGIRRNYWPWFKAVVLIFYIIPTFFYTYLDYERGQAVAALRLKAKLKAEQILAKANNNESQLVSLEAKTEQKDE